VEFFGEVVRWFTTASHWQGEAGALHRLTQHVGMSASSLAVAAVLALPLGIWLGHTGRGGAVALNVSNIGRALPSFAILVLAAQLVGIGWEPAFVALVALGAPPMLTNAYIGMRDVDADVRESARGMGMTGVQSLWRVELPVALPLVMTGVRTAAVQVVATAALAALVASGGLGRFIVDGLSQRDFVQVFAGALLVAMLSILTELILAVVQRLVVPRALRERESDKNEPFAALAARVEAMRE
jgi:osmoprotectant transport system permease protein